MTIVFVGIGLLVAAGIVLVAIGAVSLPSPPVPDRPIAELPVDNIGQSDVDDVRFGVGLRGYRMDEVDGLLDRLAAELADKDARLAELEAQLGGQDPGDLAAVEVADAPAGVSVEPPAPEPGSAAVSPVE